MTGLFGPGVCLKTRELLDFPAALKEYIQNLYR